MTKKKQKQHPITWEQIGKIWGVIIASFILSWFPFSIGYGYITYSNHTVVSGIVTLFIQITMTFFSLVFFAMIFDEDK